MTLESSIYYHLLLHPGQISSSFFESFFHLSCNSKLVFYIVYFYPFPSRSLFFKSLKNVFNFSILTTCFTYFSLKDFKIQAMSGLEYNSSTSPLCHCLLFDLSNFYSIPVNCLYYFILENSLVKFTSLKKRPEVSLLNFR